MRLLDRYLFRELLAPLAYCLGGFLIFWVSYDAFKSLPDFQEDKLHSFDIIEYYLAMTPEFIVTILPIALLLALLYALTDHARHNEITAMRAAGVSLWRVCLPYLIVGFLASIALFALNEFLVPHNADWANRILNRHVRKVEDVGAADQFHGFINAREHRLWKFDEYRVSTGEMLNPIVSWTLPDGLWRQVQARRAEFTNSVWIFFKATEHSELVTNGDFVPVLQTNLLAMPQFTETPEEILSEMKINEYQSFRASRRPDIPLADIIAHLRLHPDLSRADSRWLFTKFYGRLAAPWTCLVVVLIAIPFGAASGRRNLFVGVAGSIFICFGYYVIQSVSLALGLAPNGHLPPWLAAWLPNLIFGTAGLVLTARVR